LEDMKINWMDQRNLQW